MAEFDLGMSSPGGDDEEVRLTETTAKTILVPTKVPSADYVANPYTGCQFACSYCYASFMGRFVGEPVSEWGNYVQVKTNAVDLARAEIPRLAKKEPNPRIAISTVTDPYQGAERTYRLTRGILQAFVENDYQGRVSILTKSPMVTEDIDLLGQLARPQVGISVTATDDPLTRTLEAHAPTAAVRLRTLETLNEAGVPTYAFVGPFLPHMQLRPELIDSLFAQIAEAGTTDVKVEYLNLSKAARVRLKDTIAAEPEEVQAVYASSQQGDYQAEMEPVIRELLDTHGLTITFDEIIVHIKEQNLTE